MLDKPLNKIQIGLAAIRVRTLPIPTIQVITGVVLAYVTLGRIDVSLMFYTLAVALWITIGTNLINDVFDFDKGGDLPNRAGHKKMISAGLLVRDHVYFAGVGAFFLAIVCSIPLAFSAGWWVFFLVILSSIIGYGYTGGPFPICYLGLSELFILIFYGFVCVGASFYLQTGFVSEASILCALQMGLLAILPNALNNYRDIKDDAKVNKLTLAVRLGANFCRYEIIIVTLLPFVLNFYWFKLGYIMTGFLPFCLTPITFLFIRSIAVSQKGILFNQYFGMSVIIHFLFGLLLIAGFVLN